MRFLFAAATALSLSACFGAPGEPLSTTRGAGPAAEADQADEARLQLLAPGLNNEVLLGAQQQPGEEPSFHDAALEELALTVDYASVQALAAADAGFAHNRASAELAAIELANAAALVGQRAQEMQALSSSTEECGCGGCTSEPGTEVPGVEEAAVFSALAAEFGGEIADGLNPPSEVVCGSGCGAACEEVPGTVDDVALALAIEGALDAAEGCAAAGETIGAL